MHKVGRKAQVSLHTLGQSILLPAVEKALKKFFKDHGLEVLSSSMSTLFSGESSVVFQVLPHTFTVCDARRNG
jgi:hypothetical protein